MPTFPDGQRRTPMICVRVEMLCARDSTSGDIWMVYLSLEDNSRRFPRVVFRACDVEYKRSSRIWAVLRANDHCFPVKDVALYSSHSAIIDWMSTYVIKLFSKSFLSHSALMGADESKSRGREEEDGKEKEAQSKLRLP